MNLFDVYPLYDIEIVKGKGCYVEDSNGCTYLDMYGGHAVISIGHTHPTYLKAITEQASKLVFYSNAVQNGLQKQLAETLGRVSGYDDYSLFLINSGAEANENALKLASFHNGKTRVIAFEKAFHGRTSAAVCATYNRNIVAPINEGFQATFLPLENDELLEQELAKGDVCAVIIEGILGVGGIHIPSDSFMLKVRELCSRYQAVMIVDEIQSGYGRTGKFFAHQYSNVKPDIITSAKGIANGYPFAAVLISHMFEAKHGMLGTTFGGNHLGCAASLAVLEVIEKENLMDNAAEIGTYIMNAIKDKNYTQVKEVRGKGLMIAIEFHDSAVQLREHLLFHERVFTGAAGSNIIRLLPPLTLTKEDADLFLVKLDSALQNQ